VGVFRKPRGGHHRAFMCDRQPESGQWSARCGGKHDEQTHWSRDGMRELTIRRSTSKEVSSQLVEDGCQIRCLRRPLNVVLTGDRGTRVAELGGRIVIAPLAIDQGRDRLSE
jgi:hypothetical protein